MNRDFSKLSSKMSNIEDSTQRIGILKKPTKSFIELFDKTVDDNDSVKNKNLNSDLLNHEIDDTSQIVRKQTGDIITKISPRSETFDVKQNDFNLSLDKYLDKYLLTQESVCTECRFSNEQISFFSSFNNTQRYSQTNCFSPCRDQIIDIEDKDLRKDKRSLKKRSRSVTPEKKYSDINKKFKSEENVSVPISNHVDKVCRSEFLPIELDGTFLNFSDRDKGSKELKLTESVEKFVTLNNIKELSIGNEVSVDKETSCSLSGKNITSQSRNRRGVDSSFRYSLSSENTAEKIYRVDDELLMKELQDFDNSESNSSSTFSQSTIEEIYYMNTADDNRSQTIENLRKESTAIETRVKDHQESQSLIETGLKGIETVDNIIEHNVIQSPNDLVTDVNSTEVQELNNAGALKVLSDSILEISIESETEKNFVKRDRIVEKEKIRSVNVVSDSKTNFLSLKNVSERNKEKRNMPVDLTTLNPNSSHARDIVSLSTINTQNVGTTILVNDPDTQLLTDTQLENTKLQDCGAIKEKTCLAKARNTLNKDVEMLNDDLNLETLSEVELQRIEAEAYSKAEERSDSQLRNVNAKPVYDEAKDVFYRPERSNIIINESSDGPVVPNWVTNPAPEPNYNQMKHTIRTRREYIKKMLQEIHRLSDIVSKVGSILYAEHKNIDTKVVPECNSEIGKSSSIPFTENKQNNEYLEPGTSADTQMATFHNSGNATNTDLKKNEIFYVPDSSIPKCSVPLDKISAIAHRQSKDVRRSGKLYEPRSITLQNDLPPIFNRVNEVKFERRNISGDNIESGTSNMFGSLRRSFDGNKSCKTNLSSIWYNGFDNTKWDSNLASKNREKIQGVIKAAEYHLPKINSPDKNKCSVLNTSKFNPVGYNDTIFYSPGQFSSGLNNRVILQNVKTSETFFSPSFTQRPLAQAKEEKKKSVNISLNSNRDNNDNIFYTGNKKKEGGTLKIL